ncbi:hypothetical protein JTB14_004009 [Gonioctena quinquepunctata]|nr:hypothetical protein JTB14_004009 [Gonioctena quinquepunctata]
MRRDVWSDTVIVSRDVIFSEYEKGNSLLNKSSEESRMFFFPEPDHESDSGPSNEDFFYEESCDSSGEEPPNLEEDQSDPDFVPPSLPEQHLRRGERSMRPPQTHDDYVSYLDFVENFSNPTSVEEVLASPDKENWLKAMDRKYKAQIDTAHGN